MPCADSTSVYNDGTHTVSKAPVTPIVPSPITCAAASFRQQNTAPRSRYSDADSGMMVETSDLCSRYMHMYWHCIQGNLLGTCDDV